ncbi:MAG: metallophosphoesterase [Vicingaceae bacterium]
MYYTVFIIITLIFVLLDWYFYRAVKVYLNKLKTPYKTVLKFGYWLVTIATIVLMLVASSFFNTGKPAPPFIRSYVVGLIFVMAISKLIGATFILLYDLASLLVWSYRKISKNKTAYDSNRRLFLKKAAVIGAGLPFVTFLYGMIRTAFDYKVRTSKIKLSNLPSSFKGLKIVQISDFHIGSFISEDPVLKVVEIINKLEADVVVFTGDLVNELAEEALPYLQILKNVKAKMGVFSILGNHDYGDYFYQPDEIEKKEANKNLMKKIYKDIGWKLLLNEHAVLTKGDDKLVLLGVENWGDKGRFQKYGDITKAKMGTNEQDCKILLSHDPSHWEAKVLPEHKDIALTLSGHTHGMQFGIEIPGFKWSPSKYMYPQWAGLYKKAEQYIYVNRGIGFIGYPGRVGILPEITLIELA